jgi:Uncharacterized protein conserved in bacteria (DUF2059)
MIEKPRMKIEEIRMRSKICLWAIFLSLLPIISYAQNQNSPIQELYIKSGLEVQLGQIPASIQAKFDQSIEEQGGAQKLPKAVLSDMKASIAVAFAPEGLKEVILAELSEKLTAQDIKEALNWFDSPVGRKCTKLEEAASAPEAQKEIVQYAARLKDSPPSAERLKAVRGLDSAVKATESAVDIAINSQVAIAMAVIATFPVERQRSLEDVSREAEKARPVLESAVRSYVLVSQLYTYESLSEAEIERYTEFAKSPVGLKFGSTFTTALKKALLRGAVKWGRLIGESIKGIQSNSDA